MQTRLNDKLKLAEEELNVMRKALDDLMNDLVAVKVGACCILLTALHSAVPLVSNGVHL
jgi:hypothetical protein